MSKPIVLQLGDNVRWSHDIYAHFQAKFEVRRSYSMTRSEFLLALKKHAFGDFYAIYRPFWNTGGEMGNWDEELISSLPKSCRIYASAGAGFDWVDTACLARNGILYCNSASACTESVADAATWLILSTFRLFSWSAVAARSTDPTQFTNATRNIGALSRNPQGQTLGIIGMGQIGRRVAEKAFLALGMRIHYSDLARIPTQVEHQTDATFHEDLSTLLTESDCVVLAAPFTGRVLLDELTLGKMKKGSRLVNISRGKLIDEEALVDALNSGHICAAGLDVHQNEPHVNPVLARLNNVELTSHTAGASLDSHMGFERLGMENIMEFQDTGKAISPVNAHLIQ